jgi:hypothetical protein
VFANVAHEISDQQLEALLAWIEANELHLPSKQKQQQQQQQQQQAVSFRVEAAGEHGTFQVHRIFFTVPEGTEGLCAQSQVLACDGAFDVRVVSPGTLLVEVWCISQECVPWSTLSLAMCQ